MIDITVRGAGIFGLSIAWACLQRGARVRIVDPVGAGAGASGGIVGALAPHVPEQWNDKKAFQLDSLLMAGAFWEGVATAGGVDPGYGRTGRLQPVADTAAHDLAQARADGAQDLWRGAAIWELRQVPAGPWTLTSPTGLAIFDSLSARLHPRRACASLVAALAARGVVILPEAEDAGQVILASGAAGLAALGAELERPVGAAIKGQAALLRADAGADAPQLFCDGLHIIPHSDGTVAIGSTTESAFDDPNSTDAQLETLIARARAAVPALADAPVIERWAGLRPRARSRAPLLGPHPTRPGQFIANGGFKIGFGMAPKVAEVMADLLLEGRDTIPPAFHTRALS